MEQPKQQNRLAWRFCQLCVVVALLFLAGWGGEGQAGTRGTVLRIGIFPFEPLNFLDAGGQAQGLNVDLLQQIARDNGWTIEFVPVTWAEGLEKLQRQEIDLMPSVAFTPERARVMDYTDESVVELWGQVFVRPEHASLNIDGLAGRRVGIMRRDISGSNFVVTAARFGVRCEIVEFATHVDIFSALRDGRIDAGVAPQHFGLRHAAEYGLAGSSILFSPFSIYFASRKGAQGEVLRLIDAQLAGWKRDPRSYYYDRLGHWLGIAKPASWFPVWVMPVAILVLAVLLLFVVFNILLRRRVSQKTMALRRSEANLLEAQEIARLGGWEIDLQDNRLYWSESLLDLFGLSRQTAPVSFQAMLGMIHPDDRQTVERVFRGALEEGKAFSIECRLLLPDGRSPWVHAVGRVECDDRQRPLRAVGAIQDISGRKLAEEKIRETGMLLHAVLEGTTDAIFVKDRAGRYLLANSGTCSALGLEVEKILGRTDLELFPPESVAVIAAVDNRVMTDGRTILAEERLEIGGSESYWLVNKSPYFDEQRNIIGLIGISRDITGMKKVEAERHKLEQQLLQTQKMEAIGTLAGGIAHDFNNILGAIIGYTELACEEAQQAATISYLREVLKASERARGLIRQILAFSRQQSSERVPLQASEIIRDAMRMIRPGLPTTIEIVQDLAEETGQILADPIQLHQVVINLATNAYHAMEERGGVLRISLCTIHLTEKDLAGRSGCSAGEYCRLTISDTGHGMPPEVRERIFEPFFTTKEVGRGTGMGLAIVHGIITAHGGFVTCASESGKGTEFQVFLPLCFAHAAEENSPEGSVPGGSERIMLVDDELMLTEMNTRMLTNLGYSVTALNSGIDALQLFRNHPELFDLVIVDQTMPGMTGIELSREMLRIRPDQPIILCSGYSSRIAEEQVLAMGISSFAVKPVARSEMGSLIRQVLDRSREGI